jgi:hypothetical protein
MWGRIQVDKQKENNYEYLLGIFGEEKIKERYSFLYYLCEEFINGYGLSDYFKTSKSIIQEIVTDYFADIARLKNFMKLKRRTRLRWPHIPLSGYCGGARYNCIRNRKTDRWW